MTDPEIIECLRDSSDPDDQSLVYRWDRLLELRATPELNRAEARLVRTLEAVNEIELDFVRQPSHSAKPSLQLHRLMLI